MAVEFCCSKNGYSLDYPQLSYPRGSDILVTSAVVTAFWSRMLKPGKYRPYK